ncbi:endolytic transglycosylase MltG [Acinetobacter sp. MD2(2019)]|uniref:endolytic transglycosylase MltG n=1 Tax=Acinetobacter sp. MD2(2019) TaxID=2605273 RepID=UPI002D1F788F|nr:endolytic transglycosylase MltG [Acinetobacter sp. MD2(2019)]MEB3754387.1 endolytic transglycosylase MltG [Acinetobacter sp. MD2(2019)]
MAQPVKRKAAKKQSKAPFSKGKGLLVILLIVLMGLFWIGSISLWKTYPIQGERQLISVNNGETYTRFIDSLAKENKVKLPIVLKIYQKFMIHDSLKAGVYEVRRGMSVRQVLNMMSNAENAQMNRILVIEGTTFKQLIERLQQDPLVDKTVVNLPTSEMVQALGIPYAHLEGLFAPNTYFYNKGESDKKILLDLYHHQMENLDAAWAARAPNLPYKNKYEALTMASIIEKETSLDKELPQVAGVFVRRLQQGMRLQTDPTVIYGMGERYQGKLTKDDLRTPTAYNTYTMAGLPPTPIALAGKKAIQAALHPDQSNNIYFVATGNGGHTFTANLEDHNRAVQQYLAVLRAKKSGATP